MLTQYQVIHPETGESHYFEALNPVEALRKAVKEMYNVNTGTTPVVSSGVRLLAVDAGSNPVTKDNIDIPPMVVIAPGSIGYSDPIVNV
jgi:hypothetical protein